MVCKHVYPSHKNNIWVESIFWNLIWCVVSKQLMTCDPSWNVQPWTISICVPALFIDSRQHFLDEYLSFLPEGDSEWLRKETSSPTWSSLIFEVFESPSLQLLKSRSRYIRCFIPDVWLPCSKPRTCGTMKKHAMSSILTNPPKAPQ